MRCFTPPQVGLFDDGGLGVAEAGGLTEEGFGGAEAEVHVEADGDVVEVVGDVEGDDLTLFVLVVVPHRGEDKASVGDAAVVHLEFLLTAIDEDFVGDAVAVGHLKVYLLAFAIVGSVKSARADKHTEHVTDGGIDATFSIEDLAVIVGIALAQVYVAIAGIVIPHLVDVVAFAFACALAEEEGHEFGGEVADDGVAHHEEAVGAFVALGEEGGAQDVLVVVAAVLDLEVGGAGLQPDELPVEVELVVEALASREGAVLQGLLGMDFARRREGEHEKQSEK